MRSFFITTPIYYVNDRPHIGHLYTTIMADIIARFHRLRGARVLLSSGTDEHALKVLATAKEHGLSPAAWAERNSAAFRAAFHDFDVELTDFIRTSEPRHKEQVRAACDRLLGSGDFYRGRFVGWYDEGQEEFVPEARAVSLHFLSPATGRPLVRRGEEATFFRISRHAPRLLELIEHGGFVITPEARRQEVLARLHDDIHDVPVTRRSTADWGVAFPGAVGETVYVWIDALFNYLTVARTQQQKVPWPPDLHLIGKEILWFHAVLWPALLLALGDAGEALDLPRAVHAHSHWVRDGRKMSKSLGNFVDLEALERLAGELGTDAVRWFFAAQGPFWATDSDFSEHAVRALREADLANGIGNCVGRVTGIVGKHFGGRLPAAGSATRTELRAAAEAVLDGIVRDLATEALDGVVEKLRSLVSMVDRTIQSAEPYRLARHPSRRGEAEAVLHDCAQALYVAASLSWPVIPRAGREILARFGRPGLAWPSFGDLPAGTALAAGTPLFPRTRT